MSDSLQRGNMGVESHHYLWMYARFAHRRQQNRVIAFLAVNLLPHPSNSSCALFAPQKKRDLGLS